MAQDTGKDGDPAPEGREVPDAPARPYVKKEREPDPEPPGAPEWIVTFTDMISLLVTFFVLLMTFSSMDEHDLLRVSSLLNGSPGMVQNHKGGRVVPSPDPDLISNTDPLHGANAPHSRPSEELPEELSQSSTRQDAEFKPVDLNRLGDGLAVAWDKSAGYGPNQVDPNPILRRGLDQTARTLLHYPHLIVVEGHAADDFVPSAEYPDAEAIAFERARRAAQVLIQAGIDPERIQLVGYGTARPRAVGKSAGVRALNRRVELRILSLPVSRRDRVEAVREAVRDAGGPR